MPDSPRIKSTDSPGRKKSVSPDHKKTERTRETQDDPANSESIQTADLEDCSPSKDVSDVTGEVCKKKIKVLIKDINVPTPARAISPDRGLSEPQDGAASTSTPAPARIAASSRPLRISDGGYSALNPSPIKDVARTEEAARRGKKRKHCSGEGLFSVKRLDLGEESKGDPTQVSPIRLKLQRSVIYPNHGAGLGSGIQENSETSVCDEISGLQCTQKVNKVFLIISKLFFFHVYAVF